MIRRFLILILLYSHYSYSAETRDSILIFPKEVQEGALYGIELYNNVGLELSSLLNKHSYTATYPCTENELKQVCFTTSTYRNKLKKIISITGPKDYLVTYSILSRKIGNVIHIDVIIEKRNIVTYNLIERLNEIPLEVSRTATLKEVADEITNLLKEGERKLVKSLSGSSPKLYIANDIPEKVRKAIELELVNNKHSKMNPYINSPIKQPYKDGYIYELKQTIGINKLEQQINVNGSQLEFNYGDGFFEVTVVDSFLNSRLVQILPLIASINLIMIGMAVYWGYKIKQTPEAFSQPNVFKRLNKSALYGFFAICLDLFSIYLGLLSNGFIDDPRGKQSDWLTDNSDGSSVKPEVIRIPEIKLQDKDKGRNSLREFDGDGYLFTNHITIEQFLYCVIDMACTSPMWLEKSHDVFIVKGYPGRNIEQVLTQAAELLPYEANDFIAWLARENDSRIYQIPSFERFTYFKQQEKLCNTSIEKSYIYISYKQKDGFYSCNKRFDLIFNLNESKRRGVLILYREVENV